MNSILEEIFQTGMVRDKDEQQRPVHSHTEMAQGKLLKEIIEELKPEHTIEIGLAYGVSSLFILEALQSINSNSHIIIEPYPDLYWDNIGLLNIERAGLMNMVEFYKDFSFNVLPKLYLEGKSVQFAYIDSTKLFDVIHTDVFYILKMLDIGGVVVLDDVSYASLRKLARLISKLPFIEIYRTQKPDVLSTKKRIALNFFRFFLKLLPFKKYFFRDQDVSSDMENGINYHCIAFRKISEDKRSWDWYEKF